MPSFPSLDAFGIDPERGFLPSADPLPKLPRAFAKWERAATMLPKTLVSGRIRHFLDKLPPLPADKLSNERELRRAMQLLSYFGQAYVWGEPVPSHRLPASIAVPWHAVADRLGRPPILSYASYALDNWVRLDPKGPVELGNIALIQNFLGGLDEEWFILINVDIEAKAGAALRALRPAQEAALSHQPDALKHQLVILRTALQGMYDTLKRMPEACDPYIYYRRVRPYIHGWKNHPALPAGVVYEGVAAYNGQPQTFRGETGAQSSIIPALDALLGVDHENDLLRTYLMEMRGYMPAGHRRLEVAAQIRTVG